MTPSNSRETNDVSMHEQSEILRLSQVVLRAICSHDQQALEPILAQGFVLLGDSRRLDRRAFLEAVGSADFVAVDATFESIEIELLAGVAVAAGVQRVEVELPDGSRAVSRGVFTDVFVRDSGEWRLRLAHSMELS